MMFGFFYILVLVDNFSNFLMTWLVRSKEVSESAEKFEKFLAQYGYPKVVVADNGPPFS